MYPEAHEKVKPTEVADANPPIGLNLGLEPELGRIARRRPEGALMRHWMAFHWSYLGHPLGAYCSEMVLVPPHLIVNEIQRLLRITAAVGDVPVPRK